MWPSCLREKYLQRRRGIDAPEQARRDQRGREMSAASGACGSGGGGGESAQIRRKHGEHFEDDGTQKSVQNCARTRHGCQWQRPAAGASVAAPDQASARLTSFKSAARCRGLNHGDQHYAFSASAPGHHFESINSICLSKPSFSLLLVCMFFQQLDASPSSTFREIPSPAIANAEVGAATSAGPASPIAPRVAALPTMIPPHSDDSHTAHRDPRYEFALAALADRTAPISDRLRSGQVVALCIQHQLFVPSKNCQRFHVAIAV